MPLTWACMKGDNEMIDILVDAGADIQAVSQIDGDTPLHRAVKYGHLHAARHLLKKVKEKEERAHLNSLVNFVSALFNVFEIYPVSHIISLLKEGMVPLHYAAKYGFDDVGELLMGMGGDPELRDNSGRSCFDYAEQNGHRMMLALLRDPIQARAEAAADAGFSLSIYI